MLTLVPIRGASLCGACGLEAAWHCGSRSTRAPASIVWLWERTPERGLKQETA